MPREILSEFVFDLDESLGRDFSFVSSVAESPVDPAQQAGAARVNEDTPTPIQDPYKPEMHAHVSEAVASESLPVGEGTLAEGTWQQTPLFHRRWPWSRLPRVLAQIHCWRQPRFCPNRTSRNCLLRCRSQRR